MAQTKAQELADELLGTCEPLDDEVIDDLDLCFALDEIVRQCETCSWWVRTHEVDDDGNCKQCQEEQT